MVLPADSGSLPVTPMLPVRLQPPIAMPRLPNYGVFAEQYHQAIPQVVTRFWIEGKGLTVPDLARALDAMKTGGADTATGSQTRIHDALRCAIQRLRSTGHLMLEKGAIRRTGAQKRSYCVAAWDPLGRPADPFTLRHALAPYLDDPDVDQESAKHPLRTVLRTVLPLLGQSEATGTRTDRALLACADRISLSELTRLPGMVRALPGLATTTSSNYLRAVRNFLKYVAARQLVPLLIEQRGVISDPWGHWVDAHFPLKERGTTAGIVRQQRMVLMRLRDELDAICGPSRPATPHEVTPELASAAMRRLATIGCQSTQAREYRCVLWSMGRQKLGPFRDLAPDFTTGPQAWYLPMDRRCEGESVWDTFDRCLETAGVSDADRAFFRWFEEYSTLDRIALGARMDEFPSRHHKRLLGEDAQKIRVLGARVFFGLARDLGQPLTVAHVFGVGFRALANELQTRWKARADRSQALLDRQIDPPDRVQSAVSVGLGNLIVQGGLIAESAYRRSLHQRRTASPTPKSAGDAATMQVTREAQRGDLTFEERAFLEAYEISGYESQAIAADRGGAHANTNKNKDTVLAETAADMAPVHAHAIAQLQALLAAPLRNPELYHLAMAAAVGLAIDIAGPRGGELAYLTVSEHGPGFLAGQIALKGIDRKRNTNTFIMLPDALYPRWLREFVLNVARPYLLKHRPDEGHLFLNSRGAPFAKAEGDVSARPGRARRSKPHSLSAFYERWRARMYRELGTALPAGFGINKPHAARNRTLDRVNHATDLVTAAMVGGNTAAVVAGAYTQSNAAAMGSALLRAHNVPHPDARPNPTQDPNQELLDLVRARELGQIDMDACDKRLRVLSAQLRAASSGATLGAASGAARRP